MFHEPEFLRELRVRRVLRERGIRDAQDGLPPDPDPLSDDALVDLGSFSLSEPEHLTGVFLAAYRGGHTAGLSGVVGS